MNSLEKIKTRAQGDANREGKPAAILNLNQFQPLYVIRAWDDRYIGDRQLVARVTPATIDQGG